MLFLRNYKFDYLHEVHQRYPYTEKKDSIQISVFWVFASKLNHSQIMKFFLMTCVEIQSQIPQ